MIAWLHPGDAFPHVTQALHDPNGLLAAGGDLSVPRLLEAYRHGIFPWFNPGDPILWWSPDPRMVLFPAELKVSRSLRKTLKKRDYEIRVDSAFRAVMQACGAPRAGAGGTWISDEMVAAYSALHGKGLAHSVEIWRNGELVGGLYGVALGRMFYGESMFSRATDASKIAFVHLVKQLERWGFGMIDCQMKTAHLATLGAREIPRAAFVLGLAQLIELPHQPGRWQFDHDLIE
ncbi:leucyl/phenylalanyl-tRNA--protein transferase [Sulfurimicrobium lacus]|uniref:Leucyl/phenylalanyl-tRNA--protein transferase n=1 Tax=Sulfurimicrobium lacus TaxID=2715678 RepID=A0A6F8VDF5_9PROT|nr:leucyl/phenylalanyl-tRNA--protein transferase [Sulfurimicrobium lacus]BCB27127.1 leucyl/phenylalanyl-tRNA--protein transferase [Sulfurimicrobium lacus]